MRARPPSSSMTTNRSSWSCCGPVKRRMRGGASSRACAACGATSLGRPLPNRATAGARGSPNLVVRILLWLPPARSEVPAAFFCEPANLTATHPAHTSASPPTYSSLASRVHPSLREGGHAVKRACSQFKVTSPLTLTRQRDCPSPPDAGLHRESLLFRHSQSSPRRARGLIPIMARPRSSTWAS